MYILYMEDDPEVSARIRSEKLKEHLAYLEEHRGKIVIGGAMLADDCVTRRGSALILNVPDRATAEAFSANEPFRRAGLYAMVRIERMRRAQWYPENAPATPDG
jgi:uncharacterized protein YciI